jgi:hypothetical protein
MAFIKQVLNMQSFITFAAQSYRIYQDGKPGDTSYTLGDIRLPELLLPFWLSSFQLLNETDDKDSVIASYIDVPDGSGWQHLLVSP